MRFITIITNILHSFVSAFALNLGLLLKILQNLGLLLKILQNLGLLLKILKFGNAFTRLKELRI